MPNCFRTVLTIIILCGCFTCFAAKTIRVYGATDEECDAIALKAFESYNMPGIGSSDDLQLQIIAVSNTGANHAFNEADSGRLTGTGIAGKVSGSDVKVYVRIQYGDDVTVPVPVQAVGGGIISDVSAIAMDGNNGGQVLSMDKRFDDNYKADSTVTLDDGTTINMKRRFFRFKWDTTTPQQRNRTYRIISFVGYMKTTNNEVKLAVDQVIVKTDNNFALNDEEDIAERKEDLKVVVSIPNNDHPGAVIDSNGWTLNFFTPAHLLSDFVNIVRSFNNPVQDAGSVSSITNVIDSNVTIPLEAMYFTNQEIETISSPQGLEKTYFIKMRAINDENDTGWGGEDNDPWTSSYYTQFPGAVTFYDQGTGWVEETPPNSGYYSGTAMPIYLNIKGMGHSTELHNAKMIGLQGNQWDAAKQEASYKNFMANNVTHEIGHAIGIFTECGTTSCLMHGYEGTRTINFFDVLDEGTAWNCPNYDIHKNDVLTRLRLID